MTDQVVSGTIENIKKKAETKAQKCGFVKLAEYEDAYFIFKDSTITNSNAAEGDVVNLTVKEKYCNKIEVTGSGRPAEPTPPPAPGQAVAPTAPTPAKPPEEKWRTPQQIMRTSAAEIATNILNNVPKLAAPTYPDFWQTVKDVEAYITVGHSPEPEPKEPEPPKEEGDETIE